MEKAQYEQAIMSSQNAEVEDNEEHQGVGIDTDNV